MGRIGAVLGDACAVLLFVGIGRSAHHHLVSLSGMASTGWPFLVGLALGWAALAARGLGRPRRRLLAEGVVAWLTTVTGGMILRVLAGQGTAFAFVLVALAFLGAAMLGWRLCLLGLLRARRPPVQRPAGP